MLTHISDCIGGEDSDSFSLVRRPGSDKAELLTMVELDYESPRKRFELIVRAASPPLRSDVHVEVLVTDVNDNAPRLKDFQVQASSQFSTERCMTVYVCLDLESNLVDLGLHNILKM